MLQNHIFNWRGIKTHWRLQGRISVYFKSLLPKFHFSYGLFLSCPVDLVITEPLISVESMCQITLLSGKRSHIDVIIYEFTLYCL